MKTYDSIEYKGFKGYDSGLRCNNTKFEENELINRADKLGSTDDITDRFYEEPLDVWGDYPPGLDASGQPHEYTMAYGYGPAEIEEPLFTNNGIGYGIGCKIAATIHRIGTKILLGNYILEAAIAVRDRALEHNSKKKIKRKVAKRKFPAEADEEYQSTRAIIGIVSDYAELHEEESRASAAVGIGKSSVIEVAKESSLAACTGMGSLVAARSSAGGSATVCTGAESVAINGASKSVAIATNATSASIADGVSSISACTDDGSAAHNSGDNSAAISTAKKSRAEFAGAKNGIAAVTSPESFATVDGINTVAVSTDKQSAAEANGRESAAVAVGNDSRASITEYGAKNIALAIGKNSSAEVAGEDNIAFATGLGSKVKGSLGNWLICVESTEDGKIVAVAATAVDGETIKPDTYYILRDGQFVESV